MGLIDQRSLQVLFQLDVNCKFLRKLPLYTTVEEDGRLQVSALSFIDRVIIQAAKMLSNDTETAQGGLTYAKYQTNRSYHIFQRDFAAFAHYVTLILQSENLREIVGITCVKFYIGLHGLRLGKEEVRILVNNIVEIAHPHLYILQVHRADVIQSDEYSALVVKLNGHERPRSLVVLFENAINLRDKTDKYRFGFLSDYGFFRKHASPNIRNNIITYVQVYSSAAKLGRPSDCGFLSSFVLSRGYGFESKTTKKYAQLTKQYIKDLISYTKNYVRRNQRLRIEEVLTFDTSRVRNIANAMQELRVFDNEAKSLITQKLLERRLIYCLSYWPLYFDHSIGPDVHFLKIFDELR